MPMMTAASCLKSRPVYKQVSSTGNGERCCTNTVLFLPPFGLSQEQLSLSHQRRQLEQLRDSLPSNPLLCQTTPWMPFSGPQATLTPNVQCKEISAINYLFGGGECLLDRTKDCKLLIPCACESLGVSMALVLRWSLEATTCHSLATWANAIA